MNKLLLFLLLCVPVALSAQKAKMKKADRHFHNFEYSKAAEVYEKILSKKENVHAKANLAECYRLNNEFEKAEYWYSRVAGRTSIDPVFKLYYGQMLQSNGKCEEAEYWFGEYERLRPDDSRGAKFKASCREIAGYYKEEDKYAIDDPGFNSEFTEFGPAFFEGGLVFVSSRAKHVLSENVHDWNGEPFLNFFFVKKVADQFGKPDEFGGKTLNSRFHEGALSFSPAGDQIYFTRNNEIKASEKKDNTRTVRLSILTAERSGVNSWQRPRELTFNSDVYSTAAPAISADGNTMIFSSTRAGYTGGSDLFMTKKNGDRWSKPQNLGPEINTEGDEMFPFLHADGTLYFASDGHAGMGGLDVFSADTSDGMWNEVRNLGYPLNTRYDDFGLIWDEDRIEGYVSSNRPGGAGGDDIYSFVYNYVKVKGLVYDTYSGEPVENAEVQIPARDKIYTTEEDGTFIFEVPRNQALKMVANKHGYLQGEEIVLTPRDGAPPLVRIPLELDAVIAKVTVINADTRNPLEGAEIAITDKCGNVTTRVLSDVNGKFEAKMTRGCNYELTANRLGYFEKVSTISSNLMVGKSELEFAIAMSPFKEGMIVELENIYYDFNESYIREDAVPDLIQLAELLKANPELTIELGSHTDARGTAQYNRQLSQLRAASAMTYLFELGIDARRITARGYGEDVIRNRCADGVKCSDDEHQYNRRTEFKVTGTDGSWVSKDKVDIPVNTWKRAGK